MKIVLEKIWRGEQETKNGVVDKIGIKIKQTEITDKDGKTHDVTDKWISALFNKGEYTNTEEWDEGMEVEVEISENKGYFNFKVKGVTLEDRVKKLEEIVLKDKVEVKEEAPETPEDDGIDF